MSSHLEARLYLWLQQAGFPAHAREYAFAAAHGRRWRIDVAWPDHRVGVEVDGGARLVRWQTNPRSGRSQPVAVGRHGTSTDYEKLNWAAEHAWRILRFNSDMMGQPDYVLATIALTLQQAGACFPVGGRAREYVSRPRPVLRSRKRRVPRLAPGGSSQPPGSGAGSPDR